MLSRRILMGAAALALASSAVNAQGIKPGPSAAPAAATKSDTTGVATTPVVKKVNLNTATVAELEKLPKIGPAQAKAIVAARAKAKFKSWDDFAGRKLLPADSEAGIKDAVTF